MALVVDRSRHAVVIRRGTPEAQVLVRCYLSARCKLQTPNGVLWDSDQIKRQQV